MALQRLKKELNDLLDDRDAYNTVSKILRGNAKEGTPDFNGKYHILEVQRDNVAKKMKKAVERAIEIQSGTAVGQSFMKAYPKEFSLKSFQNAVEAVFNSFIHTTGKVPGHKTRFYESKMQPPYGVPGIYKDIQLSTAALGNFVVINKQNIANRADKFRKSVFRAWLDNAQSTIGTYQLTRALPSMSDVSTKDQDLAHVHDPNTTVWVAFLELRGEQISAEFDIKVTEFNLAQAILDALSVTWKESPLFKNESIGQKRAIKVSLGPNNVRNRLDGWNSKALVEALTDVQKGLLFRKWSYLHPIKAIKTAFSVPFKEQAAAAAQYKLIRELMLKNKKHNPKVKIKTKKPSLKPRSDTLKRARITKGKTRKLKLPEKITVARSLEKGKGKEASTSRAADLARLRKYINSRLSAEVRRNMGRPALINRTGRFSNSVQLLSLYEAKSTTMAKYTYLLSPYQTFENSGKRRWPMAYNPKLLIAKSIRNLARGRIQQKLTVRRV